MKTTVGPQIQVITLQKDRRGKKKKKPQEGRKALLLKVFLRLIEAKCKTVLWTGKQNIQNSFKNWFFLHSEKKKKKDYEGISGWLLTLVIS